MLFVPQTKFHTSSTIGNNLRVITASLLSLPLEEVLDFETLGSLSEQSILWKKFCKDQGYYPLHLPPEIKPATNHIVVGSTDSCVTHRVIMNGETLVWDPHPYGVGLRQRKEVFVLVKEL